MNYKVRYSKAQNNIFLSIVILILVTCFLWALLKEYLIFIIYLVLAIFLIYSHYTTNYQLSKNHLIIKMGLIPIKINYQKIKGIELKDNKIEIDYKKIKINVYPLELKEFYEKLNNKVKKGNKK